jgi:hypothetical protein
MALGECSRCNLHFCSYRCEAEETAPMMALKAVGGIGWVRMMLPRDDPRASELDMTTARFRCVS